MLGTDPLTRQLQVTNPPMHCFVVPSPALLTFASLAVLATPR
jgi:hypothetical protein